LRKFRASERSGVQSGNAVVKFEFVPADAITRQRVSTCASMNRSSFRAKLKYIGAGGDRERAISCENSELPNDLVLNPEAVVKFEFVPADAITRLRVSTCASMKRVL
jgi:hypothetical protein